MSDAFAHLPLWVRRQDGSHVPFEPDRICQSLFTAAQTLGAPSAFLIRELTDAVLHFLAQEDWAGAPSTAQIAEHVEKIVREVGHPELARSYATRCQAGRRSQTEFGNENAAAGEPRVSIAVGGDAQAFLKQSMEAYALQAVFTADVAAAIREGLLRLGDVTSPAALASLVLQTPRFTELPWWLALDDWRGAAGSQWVVDGPEWLCTAHMHPALAAHVSERLLALPTFAERQVELHLNIAEPPPWSRVQPPQPLFTSDDDATTRLERINFLDGLLERWKALDAPRIPAIAWHLHEQSFADDAERRQLLDLLRQATQGKAIRFIFDRPHEALALAEGVDRKCPGVLLEIGLDLAAFARRSDIASDGATLLKKLPSLVRIAASAARQKHRYLQQLPVDAPVKRGFLLDRTAAVVVPLGLREMVEAITGESLTRSPRSLDFALQVLRTLKEAAQRSCRSTQLEMRFDSGVTLPTASLSADDASVPPRKQIEVAGKLHAAAGAGAATLALKEDADSDLDALAELLPWTLRSTAIVRLRVQRAGCAVRQGELPI